MAVEGYFQSNPEDASVVGLRLAMDAPGGPGAIAAKVRALVLNAVANAVPPPPNHLSGNEYAIAWVRAVDTEPAWEARALPRIVASLDLYADIPPVATRMGAFRWGHVRVIEDRRWLNCDRHAAWIELSQRVDDAFPRLLVIGGPEDEAPELLAARVRTSLGSASVHVMSEPPQATAVPLNVLDLVDQLGRSMGLPGPCSIEDLGGAIKRWDHRRKLVFLRPKLTVRAEADLADLVDAFRVLLPGLILGPGGPLPVKIVQPVTWPRPGLLDRLWPWSRPTPDLQLLTLVGEPTALPAGDPRVAWARPLPPLLPIQPGDVKAFVAGIWPAQAEPRTAKVLARAPTSREKLAALHDMLNQS